MSVRTGLLIVIACVGAGLVIVSCMGGPSVGSLGAGLFGLGVGRLIGGK